METLSLFIPAKPYAVTQGWGVPNEAYRQFGFWAHNGIDFKVDEDGIVQAICEGKVTEIGYSPAGAGNYVKYRTGLVMCEGTECYIEFFYMHAAKQLVKKGDRVIPGMNLIVADNTGFSTGPHTHISAYRFASNGLTRIDQGEATNYTFDFSKYYNGQYATDLIEKVRLSTDLRKGMSGVDVKKIQAILVRLGYLAPDCVTSYYGPLTSAAIRKLQQEYKITTVWEDVYYAGELVGPKTRDWFNSHFGF